MPTDIDIVMKLCDSAVTELGTGWDRNTEVGGVS